MKRPGPALLTLLAALLLAGTARGQAADNDKFARIVRRVNAYQQALKCFSADFVQTRYFADMDEEVVFRGRVSYLAPRRINWTYTRPDPSRLVISGDDAWMIIPELEQCDHYNVAQNPKLEFFVSFFSRGLDAFGDFDGGAEPGPGGEGWLVRISPKPGQESLYAEVEFEIGDNSDVPAAIMVMETNGDWTRTRFSDADTKHPPDENLFTVKPAEDEE